MYVVTIKREKFIELEEKKIIRETSEVTLADFVAYVTPEGIDLYALRHTRPPAYAALIKALSPNGAEVNVYTFPISVYFR